jgi:hypothetical protein
MSQTKSKYDLNGVNGFTDSYADNLHVDCLIIGAGFGDIYPLHHIRKMGYNCKIFQAGKIWAAHGNGTATMALESTLE